ncbi:MAG: threonine/serine exporter family protein [Clostridia bacterium]|nr:threonine/serine exporter family protein [Clostridia bacterium]
MEKLLACAMDIGEQMVISGAEIYRVEESISRMCTSFGASRTDVFIITSNMTATVYTEDGRSFTQTRRITSSSTDYEKLHNLNRLSRRICAEKLTEEEIRKELDEAIHCKTYPFWLECLAYSATAGAFTLFFGGDLKELAVSLFAGLVVRLCLLLTEKTISGRFFSKFFSAAIATVIAYVCVKLGILDDVDMVIIGNIMTLIPGVGLTNALRDLLVGDSVSGLLRLIEAVLIAIAIAAGFFLVSVLGGFVL